MKYKVEDVKFRGNDSLAVYIQAWVEEQDSSVTVRRIFYAMVTQGHVENTLAEYRRISDITVKLRRGGFLDWDLIADDTRQAYKQPSFGRIEHAVHRAINAFRYDRWEQQQYLVQVWVEKRGHVSVLYPVTNRYDVSIVENGGRRIITPEVVEPFITAQDRGQTNVILYVGDYDPSGLQMDENMIAQLEALGVECTWKRVALTAEHLYMYELPRAYIVETGASQKWLRQHANAEVIRTEVVGGVEHKIVNKLEKDPSAQWFKSRHDGELFQVEVDALEVPILRQLVETAILQHADHDELSRVEAQEEHDRQRMREAMP